MARKHPLSAPCRCGGKATVPMPYYSKALGIEIMGCQMCKTSTVVEAKTTKGKKGTSLEPEKAVRLLRIMAQIATMKDGDIRVMKSGDKAWTIIRIK